MVLTNFIEQLEEIPLDGRDLIIMSTKLGNPGCKWMLYDDLANVKHISDLFESGINTMYILLEIEDSVEPIGHWISIINYTSGTNIDYDYGHYDPYGFSIDQELSFTHSQPLLEDLLAGQRLEENRHQHQSFKHKKTDVNTCGRHVVSRSVFYYMSNQDYDKLIIEPILKDNWIRDPDTMVSLLTAFLPPNDDVVREYFISRTSSESSTSSVRRGTPF